jgi:hypothetical protein
MAATLQQTESARATAAFQTFVARLGEKFGPFNSPGNCKLITDCIIATWGADGLKNPDTYEIAFAQLVADNKLTLNEDYIAPSVRTMIENLPAGEVARKYRTDPAFRVAFDEVARADVLAGARDESDPYKYLTGDQYRSIPPQQRAELQARNTFFYRAVQRLTKDGQI